MTAPDGFWSTADAAPGMALGYWVEAICEAFLEMKAVRRSKAYKEGETP